MKEALDVNGEPLFAGDRVVGTHLGVHPSQEGVVIATILKKKGFLVEVKVNGVIWRGSPKLWKKVA